MLDSIVFLQSFGYFGGGAIGNVLNQWAAAGIFSYAIPFLLIFALVYGILTRIKIFNENKAINGVISLAVGLMALQFPTVPLFFAQIFPALGVGLAIILVVLVISGLFIDPKNKGWMVGLMVFSMIIVAVVVFSSTWTLGFALGPWFNTYGANLIGIIVFLAIIGAIIGASKPTESEYKGDNIISQMLKSGR